MSKLIKIIFTVAIICFAFNSNLAFATIMHGDVNNDGQITADDCGMIEMQLKGKMNVNKDMIEIEDIDGDNKITSADYALLKRYLNGKLKSLPAIVILNNGGTAAVSISGSETTIDVYIPGANSQDTITIAIFDSNNAFKYINESNLSDGKCKFETEFDTGEYRGVIKFNGTTLGEINFSIN